MLTGSWCALNSLTHVLNAVARQHASGAGPEVFPPLRFARPASAATRGRVRERVTTGHPNSNGRLLEVSIGDF